MNISQLLPPRPARQRFFLGLVRHQIFSVDILKGSRPSVSSNDIRTCVQAAQLNLNGEACLEMKDAATLVFWVGSCLKHWSSKTEANYQYVWRLEASKTLRLILLEPFFWEALWLQSRQNWMAQQLYTTNTYLLSNKFSIYHPGRFWASWHAPRIPNTYIY